MKTTLNKKEKIDTIKKSFPSVKLMMDEFDTHFHEIDEDGDIVIEFKINQNEFLVLINSETITFMDSLVDYDRSNAILKGVTRSDWNKRQKGFEENLAELGFQLKHSRLGGFDDYEFYYIVAFTKDFRVSKLERASELWSEYNKTSRIILYS